MEKLKVKQDLCIGKARSASMDLHPVLFYNDAPLHQSHKIIILQKFIILVLTRMRRKLIELCGKLEV